METQQLLRPAEADDGVAFGDAGTDSRESTSTPRRSAALVVSAVATLMLVFATSHGRAAARTASDTGSTATLSALDPLARHES